MEYLLEALQAACLVYLTWKGWHIPRFPVPTVVARKVTSGRAKIQARLAELKERRS